MRSTIIAGVSALCALATPARAQQLKPYFLVIVDTSGSMAWCADGTSGGGSTCAGINNRCGFPTTRIGDAKCALQRIIDSTGDAVFGLMEFEHSCNNSCGTGSGTCDAQLDVAITSSNAALMREWVDGTCTGSCSNNFTHELTTGSGTPIAQSLRRANEYLRGTPSAGFKYPTNPAGWNVAPASPIAGDAQLACRPVSVILLTDGDDSCEADMNGSRSSAAAQALQAANPPIAATALNTGSLAGGTPAAKAFKTYVIGFGSGNNNFNPSVLDAIAQNGGTNANADDPNMPGTTRRYYPAASEAELSLALNQIIADAQPQGEICNDLDDNCNGLVDEGIQKYCDKPNGVNDATLCAPPAESQCDGVDDNCDGVIDEGFPSTCSTCTTPMPEVCDGIDNDCDGMVDEGASTLAACGPDEGECEPGQLVCVAGDEECQGAIGPTDEVCDCKDNDCDGAADNEGGGAPLCPSGQKCFGCRCVKYCDVTAEFTASCGNGLAPEHQPNGECLCVPNTCGGVDCMAQTVERDGEVVCAPDEPRVARCLCRAGACVSQCDGVTCASGEACDPRSGRCVEDSCRGLGCDGGELCDPLSGECVTDKCEDARCDRGEVCRDGECEKSCADVACGDGESCSRGACVKDECAGKFCGSQVCNPDSGKCEDDPCVLVACKKGQVCSVASGECEADPCWNVVCPASQICARGECVRGGNNPSPPATPRVNTRLFATGGGGCACSLPGAAREGGLPRGASWLGLGLLGLVLRRRRARWLAALGGALWLLVAATVLGGCRITPFCVDCSDDAGTSGDGAIELPDARLPGSDGGGAGSGGSADGGIGDAGPMPLEDGSVPHCTPAGPEVCNGKDDDCDFIVDEDPGTPNISCEQLGVCAGTVPLCAGGEFICKYGALYEPDETLCDGEDNDCDGMVDEAFPDLGQPCQAGVAVGECNAGTQQCKASGTGLFCEPTQPDPAPELCDGLDNDCDGLVDEPQSNPGSDPSFVTESFVKINNNLWMYAYEASRGDATASSQGVLSTRACSRAGALPWTNLTYDEARDACQAAGHDLCRVAEWVDGCEGKSGSCAWSYTPASGSCANFETHMKATGANGDGGDLSEDCNGHDLAVQPGDPDADALVPAGTRAECFADHTDGPIYDLSGNAKEWTRDTTSPAQNPIRGGSYNNLPAALRCDFDFAVGSSTLRLPNIGFRCCRDTAP